MRSLVDLRENGERPCAEARDVAAEHLAVVRAKLEELQALEASLAKLVSECDSACAGGPGSVCVILEDFDLPRSGACCGGGQA